MNMSTYKRVDQMAHLKQKRISDDSCRAIVIDTIMESVRPLTKAELAEEISALFHILISPTRLNQFPKFRNILLAKKNSMSMKNGILGGCDTFGCFGAHCSFVSQSLL